MARISGITVTHNPDGSAVARGQFTYPGQAPQRAPDVLIPAYQYPVYQAEASGGVNPALWTQPPTATLLALVQYLTGSTGTTLAAGMDWPDVWAWLAVQSPVMGDADVGRLALNMAWLQQYPAQAAGTPTPTTTAAPDIE